MPSSLQYKLQGLHLVLRPEPGLLDTMPLWEEANEDSFATMPVFLRVIPEYHRHTLGMPSRCSRESPANDCPWVKLGIVRFCKQSFYQNMVSITPYVASEAELSGSGKAEQPANVWHFTKQGCILLLGWMIPGLPFFCVSWRGHGKLLRAFL